MEIQAHRGGPLATVGGEVVAVLPEDSLRAFEQAHVEGYGIELDARLTRDRVPVVIHDPTLDRTTDGSGLVGEHTAAEVTACRIDVVGTAGVTAKNPGSDPVPRLDEVLDWAKGAGAQLNIEIKNIPTDPDFDPTPAFTEAILGALEASGIVKTQLIVQSFWPPNLDLARAGGWRTALLTLNQMNASGPGLAHARGYDVLSPEWPLAPALTARTLDKPVITWTLNEPAAIKTALADGVAGIISDNPGLVRSLVEPGAG